MLLRYSGGRSEFEEEGAGLEFVTVPVPVPESSFLKQMSQTLVGISMPNSIRGALFPEH